MPRYKIIFTLFLLLFVFKSDAQEKYDVRKTRWGMSVSEVMSSEYPMTPFKTTTDELEYTNVELSNGHKATILFYFRNARLNEVRYIIYGYDSPSSRGTCTNIIPLYDKIKFTHFVFQSLESKGMKCRMGWYLVNNYINPFPVGKVNCNLDQQTVEKIEKAASEANCERIGLDYENDRTNANFQFNQHQNLKSKYSNIEIFPCGADYYNTLYWLIFRPNSKIEAEIEKGDF